MIFDSWDSKRISNINLKTYIHCLSGPDGKTRFNLNDDEDMNDKDSNKKPVVEMNMTKFGQTLWDSRTDIQNCNHIELLKELGPSAIDMEIVALSPEGGGSVELMVVFLDLLKTSFQKQTDYEATHAYLGLFLKHHSDAVLRHSELLAKIEEMKPVMHQSWTDLKSDLTNAATLISFVKNALLTSG